MFTSSLYLLSQYGVKCTAGHSLQKAALLASLSIFEDCPFSLFLPSVLRTGLPELNRGGMSFSIGRPSAFLPAIFVRAENFMEFSTPLLVSCLEKKKKKIPISYMFVANIDLEHVTERPDWI